MRGDIDEIYDFWPPGSIFSINLTIAEAHARTCPAISTIGVPASSAPRRISDTLQSHTPLRDEELRGHPVSLVVAHPPLITISSLSKVSIFINVPRSLLFAVGFSIKFYVPSP